jgi:single-stranded-DNA-specific exonuclease
MEIFHWLEHHFLHFWWHAQAAGCTIHPSELPIVLNTLAWRLKNHVPVAASYTIDGILPGELCTMSIYTELQKLQPYGMDFQKPLFLTEPLSLVSMQFFWKNQEHLEICVKEIPIKIKWFFLAHLGKILQKNLPFQCVWTLELQVFLGKKSCEFFISDIVQEEVEA